MVCFQRTYFRASWSWGKQDELVVCSVIQGTLGLVCSLIQGTLLQHELENTVSNFITANHQWDLSLASIILP